MTLKEIYEYYGKNYANVCRELKIGTTTIQNWIKKDSIPIKSQMILEKLTNGLFKARLEDAKV